MRGVKTYSIAQKLRYMLLLTSGIALLVASASYVIIEVVSFRKSLVERISVLSDVTASNLDAAILFRDEKAAERTLALLNTESMIRASAVFTKDLKVIAFYAYQDDEARELVIDDDESWRISAVGSGKKEYRFTSNDMDMLTPVYTDDNIIGYLQIETSASPLITMLKQLLASVVLIWLAVMLGVYLLSSRLQRRISGPIEELLSGMQDVTDRQEYTIRLREGDDDEIGKLVNKFNDMLKQVQLRDERLSRNSLELEETVRQRTHELQLSMQDAITCKELAEHANQVKTEFLATMSHEIRTPMNGVLGMSDMMLRTDLTAKQKRYAGIIHESGTVLLNIINDILDFSKIEAGQMELECIDVNLIDIIENTVAMETNKAERKGLQLLFSLPDDPVPFVQGDPGRIQQILLNLVENAIKFTKQGEVKIILRIDQLSADAALINFEVKDTGIGIPAEVQSVIFDVFRQADGSTTRRFGGTGLGLSISKKLVELMGGEIHLESVPDQGSCFNFSIPMKRVAEDMTIEIRSVAGEHFTMLDARILLAEDNEINQQVAVDMLESLGCEVDVVANGEQAMEKLKDSGYSLVLMDCQMPVKDGYTAAREIRAAEVATGEHTKIVALTANVLSEEREKCLAAGMDDFIGKPFKLKELYQMLEKWLVTNNSAASDNSH